MSDHSSSSSFEELSCPFDNAAADSSSHHSRQQTTPAAAVSFSSAPDIAFAGPQDRKAQPADILVLPVAYGNKIGAQGGLTDQKILGGLIGAVMKNDPRFCGAAGQTLTVTPPPSFAHKRIMLLGIGKPEAMSERSSALLGGPLYKELTKTGFQSAKIVAEALPGMAVTPEVFAARLADGLVQKSYQFDKYRSTKKAAALQAAEFNVSDRPKAEAAYAPLRAATAGSFAARDLCREPGNMLTPETYIHYAAAALPDTVKLRVLGADEMEKLGMGSALAVGQGSPKKPCMIIMEYDGTGDQSNQNEKQAPLALVGKGITFDTGGISLKPGANMEAMKGDMGGSAAVVGAMKALADRKAPVKVVGMIAVAENMPDGHAIKPGDIVRSMSGLTTEIINTDAEGRLVLADALTYVQRTYNPHTVIDLATLTGAKVVALGNTFAGIFANDDELARNLARAGQEAGEAGWHLPLHADYAQAMRGTDSDLVNSSSRSRAGASTAAAYLHYFIDKDENGQDNCAWAHIDIAGMTPGFGVYLLDQYVRNHCEQPVPQAPQNKQSAQKENQRKQKPGGR